MKAIDFYKRLEGYEKEKEETGYEFSSYDFGFVDIHRVGGSDKDAFYTINMNGSVYEDLDGKFSGVCELSELEGDFELYNTVQSVWTGYFFIGDRARTLNGKCALSFLKRVIDKYTKDYNPNVCGSLEGDVFLDGEYCYRGCTGMVVYVSTMSTIREENRVRKHFWAKPFPLLKGIPDDEVLYVRLSDICTNIKFGDESRINRELEFLKSMLDASDFRKANMEGYIYE